MTEKSLGVDQEVGLRPNQQQVQERTAGRELDALVAEKVFGATQIRVGHVIDLASWTEGSDLFAEYGAEHLIVPKYSTDIADAWRIVEKVDNRNSVAREMGVRTFSLNRYDFGYGASFFNADATAETAPLAICIAALRAMDAPSAFDRSRLSPNPLTVDTTDA